MPIMVRTARSPSGLLEVLVALVALVRLFLRADQRANVVGNAIPTTGLANMFARRASDPRGLLRYCVCCPRLLLLLLLLLLSLLLTEQSTSLFCLLLLGLALAFCLLVRTMFCCPLTRIMFPLRWLSMSQWKMLKVWVTWRAGHLPS
ncbi:hypothetical protein BD408DRAFT_427277 [Parasitella parasitica]|nr:hypothetical protein BD408DRAFT_427277 [Parasitella parasitica]